jgi:Fe2+ or Zn2+ uptake regulation protein
MISVEKKMSRINDRLTTGGFRFTPQREHVYNVLFEQRDHPTAEQVFMRAKKGMADISMATVYNCLDALVKCRLVKQVNVDRAATRYCPNMKEHVHFCCNGCSGVFDIEMNLSADAPEAGLKIPRGFKPTLFDVTIHGLCPACSGAKR